MFSESWLCGQHVLSTFHLLIDFLQNLISSCCYCLQFIHKGAETREVKCLPQDHTAKK